jgi:hypothetical protein
LQVQIEAVHRRCHLLKGGLSTSTHESSFDFVMGGAVGGLADSVNEKKVREAQRRYKNIASGVVRVPCYPLRSVLAHMAQQQEMEAQSARLQPQPRAAVGGRLTVDFWSYSGPLTRRAATKPAILNATDFDAMIEVGMLVVEHGANAAQRAAVLSVLHGRHGFVRVSCHNTDDYYANPAYFEARKMPLPSYEAMQTKVHVLASEKTRSREVAGGRYMHDKHCPATKIGRLPLAYAGLGPRPALVQRYPRPRAQVGMSHRQA